MINKELFMLSLKSTHKQVKDYYSALEIYAKHGISNETSVRNAFQSILVYCCKQMSLDFVEEFSFRRKGRTDAKIDGAFLDRFTVHHGYWEAKDSKDDLAKEVKNKLELGYPRENMIFQSAEKYRAYLTHKNSEDVDKFIAFIKEKLNLNITNLSINNRLEAPLYKVKNYIQELAEVIKPLI